MTPTFKTVYEALAARPSALSVPPSRLPSETYRWTRAALKTVGIEPTDRDLETAFWSERVVDLVDQTEYFLRRHEARASRKAKARKPRH